MAKVSSTQFIKFLKKCQFDLSSFDDLSFDGLCNEPTLQYFLLWLCNSFDEDNVDIDSLCEGFEIDDACQDSESIGESNGDLFDDIILSEEAKLEACESLYKKFILLDNELRKKEKCAVEDFSIAEKSLATAIADNKSDDYVKDTENLYKLILSTHPYEPNIGNYDAESEKSKTALFDLYKSSVFDGEQSLEEEKQLMIDPENINEIAVEAQIQEDISLRQLKCTKQWLDSLKTPVDFQYLLSLANWSIPNCKIDEDKMGDICQAASAVVSKISSKREMALIERNHCIYYYLNQTLKENYEILLHSYMLRAFGEGFINARSIKTDELLTLILNHFARISDKCKNLEHIIKSCLEKTGTTMAPISRNISITNSQLAMDCHKLSALMDDEYNKNLRRRERLGEVLKHFRNGPTLQFVFLPMDCVVLFNNCRNHYEKVTKELRSNAGFYSNIKNTISGDAERTQKLMWVYFLTDPSKMTSVKHEYSSFNITFRSLK